MIGWVFLGLAFACWGAFVFILLRHGIKKGWWGPTPPPPMT
jgi:hypothetical protein